jgi:peptide/nickel transport system ATP-binding protein
VNLVVEESQSVAVVGETGSGKTMTARAIVGLLPTNAVVESGSILYRGADLVSDRRSSQLRRKIAMVFQNPMSSINPLFKVGDQLKDVLRWSSNDGAGLTKKESLERCLSALESVKLGNNPRLLDMYPFQLSGGMRQRVMIAMALLREPDLLIADEPTTALDVTTQKEILSLILGLTKSRQMGLLLITHNLGIANEVADTTYVFYAGRVVETGPTKTLFEKPLHPYTQGLIASIPSLDASRPVSGIPGEISQADREASGCCFSSRCRFAKEVCITGQPPLEETELEHRVACLFAKQWK